MARPRALLDTHGQAAEVAARLKGEPAGWRRERLLAVKFGLEGQLGLYEIAERVGRPRSLIQRWFDSFRQGGLERLLHKGRGKGTPSRLTAQAAAALRQKLAAGGWRRAAEAQRWLADTHGIVVGLATVYKYLKKLGARLKVPRPCHEKHDPAAAAAFKASLAQQLSDLKLPANRPVRLWVADEMRYGLLPVTRRVWTLKGAAGRGGRPPALPVGLPLWRAAGRWRGHALLLLPDGDVGNVPSFSPPTGRPGAGGHPPGAVGWGGFPPRRRGPGPTRQPAVDRLSALQPGVEPGRETLGSTQRPHL
jgi:transposase